MLRTGWMVVRRMTPAGLTAKARSRAGPEARAADLREKWS
jgi:hypothetical protein